MDYGINIDTVYQKVLAIANKEQRGYITPQESNLFADQAQLQIFEQYFFDINQFNRVPGNQTEYSDPLDILDEKISLFKKKTTITHLGNHLYQVPSNSYKISTLSLADGTEIQEISSKELFSVQNSLLLKPRLNQPVYIRYERNAGDYVIEAFPKEMSNTIIADYIKKPSKPNWSYVVVNEQALYDSTYAVDFELHPSEEGNLVFKILQLAGITMDPTLYQIAAQEEIKEIQQQKQ
jgi:hypothetical protein